MAHHQVPVFDPNDPTDHAAAATSGLSAFVIFLLSHYVFHGDPVPPEVSAFVVLGTTYSVSLGLTRVVKRARASRAVKAAQGIVTAPVAPAPVPAPPAAPAEPAAEAPAEGSGI